MAKIQCKMCGGLLELPDGMTSGECPYCGMLTTFPKLDTERREQLYARAEHFRQANNFDKAVSAYEAILDLDGEDPEAYWGLVLSRYGIEYVEDPATHERIPTCHRVQYESILADPDYLNAVKYAVGYDRDIYEKEAQRISEIQKDILRISAQEKPYDVFICYKESTDGGSRTKDSTFAQEVYYQLTNQGLKVFFSRITLEDKLGQQYEPYIFAALNSAKVMLVIGTKREHFEAVWVKNEWSRFLALKKKDRSRLLIPCYKDMDPYDIPEELSIFQCQDMGKIGFIQDLIRGVMKVVNACKAESKPAAVAEAEPNNMEVAGREDLRKGKAAYEIGDYKTAAMSFSLAAQDGNAEAMYLLGKCYMDGTGVEQDVGKAVKWYEKSADQGYFEAKKALAVVQPLVKADKTILLSDNVTLGLMKVEAGSFVMSAKDGENFSNEVPHRATLTMDFYIERTEVTQAQWCAVMGNNPSTFKGNYLPVECVSWNDAMAFCEKLNSSGKAPKGWKFTLPTETQWEYAARGGKKSRGYKYSGSNNVDEVAWYGDNSGSKTHPVGQKNANELGLYDMSGNVWEWCLDDWQDDSSKLTAEFTRNNNRSYCNCVERGGCWGSSARRCRSANRSGGDKSNRHDGLGFRVALVPERY